METGERSEGVVEGAARGVGGSLGGLAVARTQDHEENAPKIMPFIQEIPKLFGNFPASD